MNEIKPVSQSRAQEIFAKAHLRFEAKSENVLELASPEAYFWCDMSNPEIFNFRGRLRRVVSTPEGRSSLIDFICRCNSERVLPKAYTIPLRDGKTVTLGAEVNALTTHGMSESQFYSFIETTYVALVALFAEAEQVIPFEPIDLRTHRG